MLGDTLALVLSILGVLATLFLYKLGTDIRKHCISHEKMMKIIDEKRAPKHKEEEKKS